MSASTMWAVEVLVGGSGSMLQLARQALAVRTFMVAAADGERCSASGTPSAVRHSTVGNASPRTQVRFMGAAVEACQLLRGPNSAASRSTCRAAVLRIADDVPDERPARPIAWSYRQRSCRRVHDIGAHRASPGRRLRRRSSRALAAVGSCALPSVFSGRDTRLPRRAAAEGVGRRDEAGRPIHRSDLPVVLTARHYASPPWRRGRGWMTSSARSSFPALDGAFAATSNDGPGRYRCACVGHSLPPGRPRWPRRSGREQRYPRPRPPPARRPGGAVVDRARGHGRGGERPPKRPSSLAGGDFPDSSSRARRRPARAVGRDRAESRHGVGCHRAAFEATRSCCRRAG